MKPVIEIDGLTFDDLPGFYDEVARKLIAPGQFWGRNLDALNDVLRGGFGTPEGGFVLRWRHAQRSRACLGQSASCSTGVALAGAASSAGTVGRAGPEGALEVDSVVAQPRAGSRGARTLPGAARRDPDQSDDQRIDIRRRPVLRTYAPLNRR